jgi:hypothetical protein
VPKAREMAASLVLAKDPEKAERAVAAMGFRAGLSPTEVRDTIGAAKDYQKLVLEPKNGLDTAASEWSSGSGQASSVLDLDPLNAAHELGKVLMAGALTKTLCSELHCLLGPRSDWGGPMEYFTIAPRIRSFGIPRMVSCILPPRPGVTEAATSAWERVCAAWHLLHAPSSQIAQSWRSTLLQNGTLPLPPIPWRENSRSDT